MMTLGRLIKDPEGSAHAPEDGPGEFWVELTVIESSVGFFGEPEDEEANCEQPERPC